MGTNHISGTAEARVVEFCMHVGYVKSQQMDDKSPLHGQGQGQVTHFKFCCPNDTSGTAEAKIVKFCTQVDCIKS